MWHKVLFSRTGFGCTAGLLVNTDKVDVTDVVAVSRLFPYGEAFKMARYHVSPAYQTVEEALGHTFDLTVEGRPLRRPSATKAR
jgi:hypothetical protein